MLFAVVHPILGVSYSCRLHFPAVHALLFGGKLRGIGVDALGGIAPTDTLFGFGLGYTPQH